MRFGPAWFRRFLVNITPLEHVQLLKTFADVLWGTSKEVLASKQENIKKGDAVVAEEIAGGKDIMSILCRCLVSWAVVVLIVPQ